jgi:6-phosphogluconolactonase
VHGEVRIVDDVAAAFADFAVELAPTSIALSGGETAQDAYEALATRTLDWSEVDVYFGDERFVPVDDPDSNEGMARAALLDRVHPRAVHSLATAGDTIEAAAEHYDALVAAAPPIALVHLGLGPDGHTASLFPGSAALTVRDRLVVPNGDDLHPHPRLTFTYPALERAQVVVFTVAGADKREPFNRIRAGDDLPAAHVRAGRVVWLVDPAAAG